MKINVPKGKYVIAVSGGVDSMALLKLLAGRPGIELVVAHFNHGIRPNATKDERLVRQRAKELKLPFETGHGHLGAGVSEDTARKARYSFLRAVKSEYGAKAIITAHHQDDWIETALLNVLRGTGRKGLSSLSNGKLILRPLLTYSKRQIIDYARRAQLAWLEDPTNQELHYLRNYLRHKVLPKLNDQQRQELISNLEKVAKLNIKINNEIATISHYITNNTQIDRRIYASLPPDIGSELLSYWLRQRGTDELDRPTICRLDMSVRTARCGASQPVKGDDMMVFDYSFALLRNRLGKAVNGLV